MKKSNPKIIIGLGNPGAEYNETNHNLGKMFVLYLSQKLGKKEDSFQTPSGKEFSYVKSGKFIFAMPLVYMNSSGGAILQIAKYFKARPSEIVIIHDDSDIFIGKFKFVFDHSSAGHKGVESVIRTLKTQKFWRIKIGTRDIEEKKRLQAGKIVLNKIDSRRKKILIEVFKRASEIIIK